MKNIKFFDLYEKKRKNIDNQNNYEFNLYLESPTKKNQESKNILLLSIAEDPNFPSYNTLFALDVINNLINNNCNITFITNNKNLNIKSLEKSVKVVFSKNYKEILDFLCELNYSEFDCIMTTLSLYFDLTILFIIANFYNPSKKYVVIDYDIDFPEIKIKKKYFKDKKITIFAYNHGPIIKKNRNELIDYQKFYEIYAKKIGIDIDLHYNSYPIQFNFIDAAIKKNKNKEKLFEKDYFLILGSGDRDFSILENIDFDSFINLNFIFLNTPEELDDINKKILKKLKISHDNIIFLCHQKFSTFIDLIKKSRGVIIPTNQNNYFIGHIALFFSFALGKKILISKNENMEDYKSWVTFIQRDKIEEQIKEIINQPNSLYNPNMEKYFRENNDFDILFEDVVKFINQKNNN